MNRKTIYFLASVVALVIVTTVVSVTQDELMETIIVNDGEGGLSAVITYQLLDDTGNVYKEQAVYSFPLDTPDTAKLQAFIITTVLPNVNEAEGL